MLSFLHIVAPPGLLIVLKNGLDLGSLQFFYFKISQKLLQQESPFFKCFNDLNSTKQHMYTHLNNKAYIGK